MNGTKFPHLRSALAGGVVAALLVTAVPAASAAVSDALRLGTVNFSRGRTTTLVGRGDSAVLKIVNRGGGTALNLRVADDVPPLRVNSTSRVRRLNADLLDGEHATAFLGVEDTAADSDLLGNYPLGVVSGAGAVSVRDGSPISNRLVVDVPEGTSWIMVGIEVLFRNPDPETPIFCAVRYQQGEISGTAFETTAVPVVTPNSRDETVQVCRGVAVVPVPASYATDHPASGPIEVTRQFSKGDDVELIAVAENLLWAMPIVTDLTQP